MKTNLLKSVIGLVVVLGMAVCVTAGCSGSSDANKAEANKAAPPANEKTTPGAPTSSQAK